MGGTALESFLSPTMISSLSLSKHLRHVVLHRCAALRSRCAVSSCRPSPLCSLAANRRNWTEARHSGITHDVYIERVPLDMRNEGQWCEYNDINDHDVVMSEIPWLCVVVYESTLPYGSLILNPTLNSFSSPKHTPQTPPNSHL